MVEVELASCDLFQKLVHALTLERQVSTEQRVENNTKGPDIRLPSVQVLDYLRCHVVWRARKLSQCTLLGYSSQAKVN